MEKYIKLKQNPNATHLKIRTYYEAGGYHCASGYSPRGYYCSVTPVEKGVSSNGLAYESFKLSFTSYKKCLKEVKRRSKKAELEAENLVDDFVNDIINCVLQENNLEIA